LKDNQILKNDDKYWQSGIVNLCGIDEAGRGPLAGPVVAAALILKPNTQIPGLNDSKKLTSDARENLNKKIKEVALSYALGIIDSEEIDHINILQATFRAMRQAVEKLSAIPDFIIVDGRDFSKFVNRNTGELFSGQSIVKGDQLSASIAGASILAKVYRDQLMIEFAEQYPLYGFEKHKGYATQEHREKILTYGPCPIHRKKFLRRILETKNLII